MPRTAPRPNHAAGTLLPQQQQQQRPSPALSPQPGHADSARSNAEGPQGNMQDRTRQPRSPTPFWALAAQQARKPKTVSDQGATAGPQANVCHETTDLDKEAPETLVNLKRARCEEDNVAQPGPQQAPMDSNSESISTGNSSDANNLNKLQSLGYTEEQAGAIRADNRSAVVTHHKSLTEKGFDHAQICAIGKRSNTSRALATVDKQYELLMETMPDLTREDIVNLADSRQNAFLALETLPQVAPDLTTGSLQLSTGDLVKIAKGRGRQPLKDLYAFGSELIAAPYNLNRNEVVAIACRGGSTGLQAVMTEFPRLTAAPNNMNPKEVVAIAKNFGGAKLMRNMGLNA